MTYSADSQLLTSAILVLLLVLPSGLINKVVIMAEIGVLREPDKGK